MKRLDDALATLDLAVDILEESAAKALASRPSAHEVVSPPTPRPRKPGSKAPNKAEDVGSLFSPAQLTNVKQRLDDAIERLESALEAADGTR